MPEDAKDSQERKQVLEHLARTLKAANAARVYCPQLFLEARIRLMNNKNAGLLSIPNKMTDIASLFGDEFPYLNTREPDFVGAFGRGVNFLYGSGAGGDVIALYIQKITPVFVNNERIVDSPIGRRIEWDNDFEIEGKSITKMGDGTFKGKISPKSIDFIKVASKNSIKHGDWPVVHYIGAGASCRGYIGDYRLATADNKYIPHRCDASNHNFILTSSRFHHEPKYCHDCNSEGRCEHMWKEGKEEFAQQSKQAKSKAVLV